MSKSLSCIGKLKYQKKNGKMYCFIKVTTFPFKIQVIRKKIRYIYIFFSLWAVWKLTFRIYKELNSSWLWNYLNFKSSSWWDRFKMLICCVCVFCFFFSLSAFDEQFLMLISMRTNVKVFKNKRFNSKHIPRDSTDIKVIFYSVRIWIVTLCGF